MIRNIARTLGRVGPASLKTAQQSQAPVMARALHGPALEVATRRGTSYNVQGLRGLSETAATDGAWILNATFTLVFPYNGIRSGVERV